MQRGSSNKWRCRARGCSWLRSVIHRGRSRRLPRGSTGRRRRRYCHCNIAQQCYLHTRRDRSTNMKHYLESDYRISPSQDQTETCYHREVIKIKGGIYLAVYGVSPRDFPLHGCLCQVCSGIGEMRWWSFVPVHQFPPLLHRIA